jgi:hypothetical protein
LLQPRPTKETSRDPIWRIGMTLFMPASYQPVESRRQVPSTVPPDVAGGRGWRTWLADVAGGPGWRTWLADVAGGRGWRRECTRAQPGIGPMVG